MRSALIRRLGQSAVALAATFLLLSATHSGEQNSSAATSPGGQTELKFVNPVASATAADAEVRPAVRCSPRTATCDGASPLLRKMSVGRKRRGVVAASAEVPVENTPGSTPTASLIGTTPGAVENPEPAGESSLPPEPSPDDAGASKSLGATPSKDASAEEPLEPIAAPDPTKPAPLEVVSFKDVTPGVTKREEVDKAWGTPKEIYKRNNMITQLYSIKPFDQVEASFVDDTVVSVVVRFDEVLPADNVARQLVLNIVRPVLVSNVLGEVLGQVYPERGVLLAFEPSPVKGRASMRVTHIILEPINAETFVLRAEADLDTHYERCLKDLEIALKLEPENARANWLAARVLAVMEQFEKAQAACSKAIRREPDNPRYHVTYAQILGQMDEVSQAAAAARAAVKTSDDYPHVQARALCLLGDLTASGTKPDYRKAMAFHVQALKTADRVAEDPHPAIRVAAKEVLVDAHLGAAHDIAWGKWKGKGKSLVRWIDRAVRFAEDLEENEDGNVDQLFRVYARALAAAVGVCRSIDPQPWIDEVLRTGEEQIASTDDPLRKAQYQWDLGLALYDAVQIYQIRSEHAAALKYGRMAVTYLEGGYSHKQTPAAAYLLGRLYFRLGATYALRDQDHDAAVEWFDKAAPMLTKALNEKIVADEGRHGETFVSMGVSYWESDRQEEAIKFTKAGMALMLRAVKHGTLAPAALAVPYNNLATMHRRLGAAETAEKYQEMAARASDTKVK